MATRRPIVLVSGVQSELPVGDNIDGALYQGQQVVAGSGLVGGGLFTTDPRIDVALAANPSGLYFTGDNKIGFDGQGDNIQVIASGVGAVYRTVQDKGRDIVSVKDFGAVGDGVTDDTNNIQAAIDAANTRTVIFPAGIYKITNTLNLANNTQYTGQGGATLSFTVSEFALKLPTAASNITLNNLVISGAFSRGIGNNIGDSAVNIKIFNNSISGATLPGAGYTAGIFLTNATSCFLENNRLFDNGFGPTTAFCADIALYAPAAGSQNSRNKILSNECVSTAVSFNVVCFNIDRTVISGNTCRNAVTGSGNANGYGIAVYDVSSYTLPYSTTTENSIVNNIVTNTEGSGIYVVSADNTVITGNICVSNGTIQSDVTLPVGGISINGPYSAYNIIQSNAISAQGKDGIVLANTNYSNISNNSIAAATQHGIHLRAAGTFVNVTDNTVTASTERGIFDDVNAKTYISITGNNVYASTAAGIEINGATKSIISNNNSSNNTTYGLIDNGNYNSFLGNLFLDNATGATSLPGGSGNIRRDNKFSAGESEGSATLVGGSATVSTAEIRTGDTVLLTRNGLGGTLGHLTVRNIVNATSFVIDSSSGADTSSVSWQIIH